MKFICPHCQRSKAEAHRVQSSDDLMWLNTKLEESQELWQCDECGGYFNITYEIVKITKLEESE